MTASNHELMKRLQATFRLEAEEHLQAIRSALAALEAGPAPAVAAGQIESIFREVHSLKGAARAVNRDSVEAFCRALENLFSVLKRGQREVTAPLLELLNEATDALQDLLQAAGETAASRQLAGRLLPRLEAAASGAVAPAASPPTGVTEPAATAASAPPPNNSTAATAGTVRVATARLDMAMRQAEDLLAPRLAARQRVAELRQAAAAATAWKKRRARLRPALRHAERVAAAAPAGDADWGRNLKQILEYLDEEQQLVAANEDWLHRFRRTAVRDERLLDGMAAGLLDVVKAMQLLPFASLLDLVPRLVRDIARDRGKEVELDMQGGDVEIDRRILDELRDPLIHLLRNAVDHGIEAPAVRTAAGKPPRGRLTLAIAQSDGGRVEIRIADDGAGIDGDRVLAAARKAGAVSAAEAERLGVDDIHRLAMHSGISTSPIVTDISGHGLGLAIVREKVERLGGGVAIASRRGAGTDFRLVVPMTVAAFRAVLVRVGDSLCAIPAGGIERVARIAASDVRTVENRETIAPGGTVIALACLRQLLELPPAAPTDGAARIPVVIAGAGDARIALRVDAIVGEQEVLVKPLGPQLARVRNVAGACTLGTGQVVPVLNVGDLLLSATQAAGAATAPAAATESDQGAGRSILVAEDSITSRALIKGILESAGFAVTTAVDGAEAYAALKSAQFDLLVSDVEMPRLDGFALTAKVRADKKLGELPIVLVTALGSREHRERGIEVGANAYIVKSSFDQSNLLDVVRRLL